MKNSQDFEEILSSLSQNGTQSDTSVFLRDIIALLNVKEIFSKNAFGQTVYQPLLSLLKKSVKTSRKCLKNLSECEEPARALAKTVLELYTKRQRRIFKSFSASFNSEENADDSDLIIAQRLLMINTAITKTAQNIFRFNPCDNLRELLREIIFIQLEERKKLTYLIHCLK